MQEDVEIKMLFRPDSKQKNRSCVPMVVLGDLLKEGKLELAVSVMMAEIKPGEFEGMSQNVAVAFMVDMIKQKKAKGWKWVKGLQKGAGGFVHSWLECDGWAVDASDSPVTPCKKEKNAILVMDAGLYRKKAGLKVTSGRTGKQVTRWVAKHAPGTPEV